jgi:hypothetical protein
MPEPLSAEQIEQILEECPSLPKDYLAYMAEVGWGEAASGCFIFSAPIDPEEIYGRAVGEEVVLLGDDRQGYCLAWHLTEHRYGELDDCGEWEPWPPGEGLSDYVDERADS